MADPIKSVADSAISKVSKAEFYSALRTGDLIFCWGKAAISKAIEAETDDGPSHVLLAWLPNSASSQWLTLEATFGGKGVHVGLLKDYVDSYDGDLVLCRREMLTQDEIWDTINTELNYIDGAYDWQSEVTFAAHRISPLFPIHSPSNRLYCSALQQVGTKATPYPIVTKGLIPATPNQVFTDATVTAICAKLQGAK